MELGAGKIILILLVAFLVFGSKKLPEVGKAAGHALREFKKATSGILDDDDSGLQKDRYSKAAIDDSKTLHHKETD